MMRAAFVSAEGKVPVLRESDIPVAVGNEHIIRVKAAAISHVVRAKAAGKHYSSDTSYPLQPESMVWDCSVMVAGFILHYHAHPTGVWLT